MASLQDLLVKEGFNTTNLSRAVTMRNRISSYQRSPSSSDTSYERNYNNDLFEDEEEDEPALDKIVTKAAISILTGHLRRFFKEDTFRISMRQRCLSCLGIRGDKHVGIVASLKNAIGIVERAVVGKSSPLEVKKASLELGVITGLNSADVTIIGNTFGIPNTHLAACAHLYLAVIDKFRKKDFESAIHVLDVFCSTPNQGRTTLLPALWERFLLPHMSHLKEWFDQESESISGRKSWEKRNALLEELYTRILDTGTYQLAVYYKDWLQGVTSPEFPSIIIPNASRAEKTRQVPVREDSEDESDLYPPHEILVEEPIAITRYAKSLSVASRHSTISASPDMRSSAVKPSVEMLESSFLSTIPRELSCPLTRQLFEDPVTIETGQTYERSAILDWFNQGNKTCPVTKRRLQSLHLPDTSIIMKHVVNSWKLEHSKKTVENVLTKEIQPNDEEEALYVVEQLLTTFDTERKMENAKYIISLGGLQFLLKRLDTGDLEEKSRVVSLLLFCIQADGSCRNYLAINIGKKSMLQLLHRKQDKSGAATVSLLIELICLRRRTSVISFLHGLKTEAILKTMHVLLVHLQNSPPEEKGLVAVLLLHFDLMEESGRYSVYREEAVDGITTSLDFCLSENKVVPYTRRALLMLGGHFSSSGDVVTETRLLKQAGLHNNCDEDADDEDEPEARAKEEWLQTVSWVLLGSGKRSFLRTLVRCLGSENPELVRLCLITTVWLSQSLPSLILPEFQLSALATFIPRLKETLVTDPDIEHKVLASMSLHNFSKISEYRAFIMTFGKEMHTSLESIMDVTWTANNLFAAVCEGLVDSTTDTASESSSLL